MQGFVEWDAIGNIVLFGVIIGAGLPALYALGVRALSGPGARDGAGKRAPLRTVAAIACFSVIVAAILFAIGFIAAGGH